MPTVTAAPLQQRKRCLENAENVDHSHQQQHTPKRQRAARAAVAPAAAAPVLPPPQHASYALHEKPQQPDTRQEVHQHAIVAAAGSIGSLRVQQHPHADMDVDPGPPLQQPAPFGTPTSHPAAAATPPAATTTAAAAPPPAAAHPHHQQTAAVSGAQQPQQPRRGFLMGEWHRVSAIIKGSVDF